MDEEYSGVAGATTVEAVRQLSVKFTGGQERGPFAKEEAPSLMSLGKRLIHS
jgi:hypothetical protein